MPVNALKSSALALTAVSLIQCYLATEHRLDAGERVYDRRIDGWEVSVGISDYRREGEEPEWGCYVVTVPIDSSDTSKLAVDSAKLVVTERFALPDTILWVSEAWGYTPRSRYSSGEIGGVYSTWVGSAKAICPFCEAKYLHDHVLRVSFTLQILDRPEGQAITMDYRVSPRKRRVWFYEGY